MNKKSPRTRHPDHRKSNSQDNQKFHSQLRKRDDDLSTAKFSAHSKSREQHGRPQESFYSRNTSDSARPKKKNLLNDAVESERLISQYAPATATNISRKRRQADPSPAKISEKRKQLPIIEKMTRDRQESDEEGEITAHPAFQTTHDLPALRQLI